MENRNVGFDMFKGITITLLIVANAPGIWVGHYKPLNYSAAQGCTFADMIMPAFLFAMGGSMWFSFHKYGYILTKDLAKKILLRTLVLFGIGAVLNAFPFTASTNGALTLGFSPLQIIALVYPITAFICLLLPKRYMILTILLLLLIHWLAIDYTNIALSPSFSLTSPEDGLLPNWNQLYLPYQSPSSYLSILSACVPVLLGWLSGFVFTFRRKNLDLAVRDLAAYGLLILVVGGLWSIGWPFDPRLFSGSYLLYSTGASMLLLAILVWVYEYMKVNFGTGIFNIFGLNPLLAFLCATIISKSLMVTTFSLGDKSRYSAWEWIYTKYFVPIEAFQFGNLLMGLAFAIFVWLICRIAYHYKYFIKI